MNVYIVTRENILGGKAGASRVRCYAKALLSQNITCTVLLIKQSKGNGIQKSGIHEEIPYEAMGTEITTNRYSYRRYISYLRDDIALIRYLSGKLEPGDVIFEYGTTVFHTFFLIAIAHRRNAMFVRDLCEYPFGTQKEDFMSWLQRYIVLKFQFPIYDGVVAISDSLTDLAKTYCPSNCIIVKVPILVEFDNYNLADKSDSSDIPYIFHSGTLYEQKDGFVGMIDAFGKACEDPNFRYNFVSTGNILNSPHANEIEKLLNKYGIQKRVFFTGYLTQSDLCEYLQGASMVIINKYNNQQNKYCFSTKLAEYLAAGKPLIITKVGEAMNWLTNMKDAIIINPNDKKQLVSAILNISMDTELRHKLSVNARKTCRQSFDIMRWSLFLKEFFLNVSNKSVKK